MLKFPYYKQLDAMNYGPTCLRIIAKHFGKSFINRWASPFPILAEMNELKPEHRSKSDDPDFWESRIRKKEGGVNRKELADDWQNTEGEEETE